MSESAKSRPLPEKLKLMHQPKYGPPVPKYLYYRKKSDKTRLKKYINTLKKSIIGVNLTTNIEISFESTIDCEKYFKASDAIKFNRASLRKFIKENRPYYGYLWRFK